MRERKENLPVALELPVAKFQRMDWGETAVTYVQLTAGADAAPLLEGLPQNKCSCPHWGYVLKGAVHVEYADGQRETVRAGDTFYWPAGHTVRVDEDTAFLEFSPKDQLTKVYDHIGRKVGARA
jgi:ethanolamine utilization protein EutQ (cupin superfamily)